MKKDELELIKSVENEEWKSVKNLKDWKQKLKKAASATMNKDARMNIRVYKKDLEILKVKALEQGLPYQTLVSSILHKYVTGKMIEKIN